VNALEVVNYTVASSEALTTARTDLAAARLTVDLAPTAKQADFDARLDAVLVKIDARQVVLTQLANQTAVNNAASALVTPGFKSGQEANTSTPELNLPATGTEGTTIAWSSSNTSRVTNAGVVERANSGNPVPVTLTATITKGEGNVSATKTVTYTVTVPNNDDTQWFTPGTQYAAVTVGNKKVN
jgi:hypothetical protein